jgi:hypothetical protein
MPTSGSVEIADRDRAGIDRVEPVRFVREGPAGTTEDVAVVVTVIRLCELK